MEIVTLLLARQLKQKRVTVFVYICCLMHILFAGMVKRVVNAKIACLDFSLQKTKMKLGVQVVISDPEKLDQIRQR